MRQKANLLGSDQGYQLAGMAMAMTWVDRYGAQFEADPDHPLTFTQAIRLPRGSSVYAEPSHQR